MLTVKTYLPYRYLCPYVGGQYGVAFRLWPVAHLPSV